MLCKTWGGPCTNANELKMALKLCKLKKIPIKKILRSEISFRKITTPRDVIERPQLYKLNKLTEIQLEENFIILLSTEFKQIQEMPEEDKILDSIRNIFHDI
jgi:hypothetical protein